MPRATCRCGQVLTVAKGASERVVCPKCGARVRVKHQPKGEAGPPDPYIRFECACGKKLKFPAVRPESQTHGKCPDCGRIVAVPTSNDSSPVPTRSATPPGLPPGHPESPTVDLAPNDLARLAEWSQDHLKRTKGAAIGPELSAEDSTATAAPPISREALKTEAGLRICPKCGKPIHMGAPSCRDCGTPVPRR